MNLNCIICAEIFSPSDDVFVTTCGHMFHHHCLMQWLERAKTCPQCRHKCCEKNIHKIYFNISNDSSRIDVGNLQQQLEFAELTVKATEQEITAAKNKIQELDKTMKKAMKTIAGLENKIEQKNAIILSFNEQVAILKEGNKHVEDLRNQVQMLNTRIELMSSVESLLAATESDVDKMLKDETDAKTLSVWVATLKRELRACEGQKTNVRNSLKVAQYDLKKEREKREALENKIVEIESENYRLNVQVARLEKKSPSPNDVDQCSFDLLSPVNTVPKKKICVANCVNIASSSIPDRVKEIQESNSPYLNIKQSSIGLTPFLRFGKKFCAPVETLDKPSNGNFQNVNLNQGFIGVEPFPYQKADPKKCKRVISMGIEFPQKKDVPFSFPQLGNLDKKKTISDRIKSGKLKRHASGESNGIHEKYERND